MRAHRHARILAAAPRAAPRPRRRPLPLPRPRALTTPPAISHGRPASAHRAHPKQGRHEHDGRAADAGDHPSRTRDGPGPHQGGAPAADTEVCGAAGLSARLSGPRRGLSPLERGLASRLAHARRRGLQERAAGELQRRLPEAVALGASLAPDLYSFVCARHGVGPTARAALNEAAEARAAARHIPDEWRWRRVCANECRETRGDAPLTIWP